MTEPIASNCRYYGYRLAEEVAIDPRLEVLDVEWFSRKHVLDIGCNDGRLTLAMACKYGCRCAATTARAFVCNT